MYHAIGYKPAEAPGITYDEKGAHLANANGDGRITTEAAGGDVRERLYATGWAKRGPVGLIGSTKSDALMIVTNMLEDLAKAAEGGRVAVDRDPESIDRLLGRRSTPSNAPRARRKAASTRRSSSRIRCVSLLTPERPVARLVYIDQAAARVTLRAAACFCPYLYHPVPPESFHCAQGAYPANCQTVNLVCGLWTVNCMCAATSTA